MKERSVEPMDLFTRDDLKTLLTDRPGPCVSIYMPTRRGGAEADPIRWRGHVKEAEHRLTAGGLRGPQARELLEPARQFLDEAPFWRTQSDGLAFFLAPQFRRLYRLPVPFADLVVVGRRFHVKPLLPLAGGSGRFFVLALSQHAVRLLQGTHHGASPVDLSGVPRNLAEALLTHEAEEPFTFHGRRAGVGAGSSEGIFHGHGVGIDDTKEELLHYFQKVDRGLHPLLREEKAPLVLAAVDYLLPLYRRANTYPHLVATAIEGNPDRLSEQDLHDRAWPLVEPGFRKARERALAQYCGLAGTGRTAGDLASVLAAAHRGEIETLFVALDHQAWGRFDPATGRVEERATPEPGDEDLLDLAAAGVLGHGGSVYAVASGQVPGGGPLAAVFCLPLPKRGKRP
jgi:hypothetical protein